TEPLQPGPMIRPCEVHDVALVHLPRLPNRAHAEEQGRPVEALPLRGWSSDPIAHETGLPPVRGSPFRDNFSPGGEDRLRLPKESEERANGGNGRSFLEALAECVHRVTAEAALVREQENRIGAAPLERLDPRVHPGRLPVVVSHLADFDL